ncbi:MAG TPA: ATP-binding protein [Candidatus Aminicenantes bacterium]|nr:ATP-binding protein [Candidatus Aminicenantes bacterium]
MFKRPQFKVIFDRLTEPRRFIQVLAGPRQSGKTTLIGQVLRELPIPSRYASGDDLDAKDPAWLDQHWNAARVGSAASKGREYVLAIDEIQKVPAWSEKVKKLWDEDTRLGTPLKVVILGSSPLLVQSGLTESLTGRFEVLRLHHWTYPEMRDAFGFDLDTFVFFGGYPGSASLIADESRWRGYVRESIIETTITRDILMMSRIDKPMLLRHLFELGAAYSGQVLSFNKLLGQLHDAGNTTTLSHYLELLSAAGLLRGLRKYAAAPFRGRASSPKLQILNTALMSALDGRDARDVRDDPAAWGRRVESAVGAHLLALAGDDVGIWYWRESGAEADFVLDKGGRLAAIEVKSGLARDAAPGLGVFLRKHPDAKSYLIGGGGLPLEEFFLAQVGDLI